MNEILETELPDFSDWLSSEDGGIPIFHDSIYPPTYISPPLVDQHPRLTYAHLSCLESGGQGFDSFSNDLKVACPYLI